MVYDPCKTWPLPLMPAQSSQPCPIRRNEHPQAYVWMSWHLPWGVGDLQGASCVRKNTGLLRSTIPFCRIFILSSSFLIWLKTQLVVSVVTAHPLCTWMFPHISSPKLCFGNGQSFETFTINISVYHVVFAPYVQICRGKADSDFSLRFILQHFCVNSALKSVLKWIPKAECQHLILLTLFPLWNSPRTTSIFIFDSVSKSNR